MGFMLKSTLPCPSCCLPRFCPVKSKLAIWKVRSNSSDHKAHALSVVCSRSASRSRPSLSPKMAEA
eukprot:15475897-Alexandrium_andersonii.AAC.1